MVSTITECELVLSSPTASSIGHTILPMDREKHFRNYLVSPFFTARMHSARFYTHRKYFCGAYVQYDVLLEEALLQLHAKEKISNEVKKIVKNLFNVANAVFSATKSKYLKNIVFYVRRLQQRAVREIGEGTFASRSTIPTMISADCFREHRVGKEKMSPEN